MEKPPVLPAAIEEAIAGASDLPPADAALLLAMIAHRATNSLHKLSRSAAESLRGQPEWGMWAKLQNVSRDAVLRTAACRETATEAVRRSTGLV